MPERPRRRVVGAARSFGGGAGSAALVLEVLVGRHGTVQRVGDPVLGLAIGCPVALCHSCVGILDGLVHVGQGLIQPLLGSAVLGRGLLGRRFLGGLLLGRLLLAFSLDSALTGLVIVTSSDTIMVPVSCELRTYALVTALNSVAI